MATMAEEFKAIFDASISKNDWDSVDEIIDASGFLDSVQNSGSYKLPFSGHVLDESVSDMWYYVFNDRSWVVTEFCRQSVSNPSVSDGYAHIMPYPKKLTYAEQFQKLLEEEPLDVVKRYEKIISIGKNEHVRSITKHLELFLHTNITFDDGSVLHIGSKNGESQTSYV